MSPASSAGPRSATSTRLVGGIRRVGRRRSREGPALGQRSAAAASGSAASGDAWLLGDVRVLGDLADAGRSPAGGADLGEQGVAAELGGGPRGVEPGTRERDRADARVGLELPQQRRAGAVPADGEREAAERRWARRAARCRRRTSRRGTRAAAPGRRAARRPAATGRRRSAAPAAARSWPTGGCRGPGPGQVPVALRRGQLGVEHGDARRRRRRRAGRRGRPAGRPARADRGRVAPATRRRSASARRSGRGRAGWPDAAAGSPAATSAATARPRATGRSGGPAGRPGRGARPRRPPRGASSRAARRCGAGASGGTRR